MVSLAHNELTHWGQNKMANIFADNIFKFNLWDEKCYALFQISPECVLKGSIVNKPPLVQVMTCCWTGDKPTHVLKPVMAKSHVTICHHNDLTHWGWDKMAAILQTTCLKCIFFNENVWISIKILLKFVPRGPINNIPGLVPIMTWRPPGDKPLSEPMMVSLLHIGASLDLNDLTHSFIVARNL